MLIGVSRRAWVAWGCRKEASHPEPWQALERKDEKRRKLAQFKALIGGTVLMVEGLSADIDLWMVGEGRDYSWSGLG